MEIIYKLNTATTEHINEHLQKCSMLFVPTLDTTVNINEYANKIRNHAHTFEAWVAEELMGLNAAYLNQIEQKIGFITNVSVDLQLQGLGVGNQLLKNSCLYAKNLGFTHINLEVHSLNKKAFHFYLKNGFTVLHENKEYIVLQIKL